MSLLHNLWLIIQGRGKELYPIIYRSEPPFARYYWADSLEWDAASRILYAIRRDETDNDYSPNKTLIRFDTRQPAPVPEEVARDVSSFFPVGDSGDFCLRRARKEWRCVTPQGEFRLDSFADGILRLENGETLVGSAFASLRADDDEANDILMKHGGFFLRDEKTPDGNGNRTLYSERHPDTPILRFKTAEFSRHEPPVDIDGILTWRTAILPGGRYLFLSFLSGDVLVDSHTGMYRRLPQSTRVYVNLNSAH
ncbi:MAG: hypothetical protein LBQ62_10190, partial [Candidatus Accumulibacter sp.]|nr:hypothetical protein [Accumulibacter sp.]